MVEGEPGPYPTFLAHLGGQVRGHSASLPLQVLVQGLCAVEQSARESSCEPRGPLWPCQASERLASSPAQELHVVEDHAELEGGATLCVLRGGGLVFLWSYSGPTHPNPHPLPASPLTGSLTALPEALG